MLSKILMAGPDDYNPDGGNGNEPPKNPPKNPGTGISQDVRP